MESVKAVILGKPVYLLGGARKAVRKDKSPDVDSPEKLLEAARRNPDAVAFGFIQGSWVAAA
jgi:hypothetical protein